MVYEGWSVNKVYKVYKIFISNGGKWRQKQKEINTPYTL